MSFCMSLMYSMNKSGPSREPCGTPAVIVLTSDFTPSTTVTCFRLLKQDLNSSRHLPSTETASNFANNPRCQTLSKAPSTSQNTPCATLPLFQDSLIQCTRYISWCIVLSPFKQAACLSLIILFSMKWDNNRLCIIDSIIFERVGKD